jgi:SAM-dependent methyltransferase
MRNYNDPHYLKKLQYANAENLEARIRIHKRFSTNPYGVFNWVFDQALAQIPAQASVLEVGSGSGEMWVSGKDRVPAGWDVTLSDFSMGILNDAKKKLADVPFEPEYREIDVQSIPYPNNSFDAVFANFMLYHVPDRIKAIAEIRRVLKPDGVLFAATLGENHMKEFNQLAHTIIHDTDFNTSIVNRAFSLENGADQLNTAFGDVQLVTYDDHLRVTEVDPMVDYFLSLANPQITSEHVEQFAEAVRQIIEKEGAFAIQKITGVFIGRGYAEK